MLEECLAATGASGGEFAIFAAIGGILLVGGIVAIYRSKGRAALLLLPLLVLGLFFGAAPSTAQAASCEPPPTPAPCQPLEQIESATVSMVWTVEDGELRSELPDAAETDLLDELFDAIDPVGSITLQTQLGSEGGNSTHASSIGANVATDYQVWHLETTVVDAANANPEIGTGDIRVVTFLIFDYPDGCGEELRSQIVYSGTYFIPPPVP